MALYENSQPSKEEALEFVKFVDANRVKLNALAEGCALDHDEKVREQVMNHSVHRWATGGGKYRNVLRYLRDKGLTGEYPPRLDIEIVYCIARILHMYLVYREHPERIKRTTGKVSERALKHVDGLLEMFKSELQMESLDDSTVTGLYRSI